MTNDRGTRWSDEDVAKLRRMIEEGARVPAIAKTLGRSQEAISKRLSIMKLRVGPTTEPPAR